MVDWSRGFSSRYYACYVDRQSWRDGEQFQITGGTIRRSTNALMEAATLNCIDYTQSKEMFIRIWLDVRQDNNSSHIPLFTGLATNPSINIKGSYSDNKLECYSVLKPLDDILLPRGWYAPKDIDALLLIDRLLRAGFAPVDIFDKPSGASDESTILSQPIIAEQGETNLTMVETLLYVINWRMKIAGDGTIQVMPMSDKESAVFSSDDNDIIETQVSVDFDWYSCPNVLRASSDTAYAVARDDDENSPLSVINRGREIWVEESNCSLNDGETLADYARRRLLELQQVSTNISYDRSFYPDIYPTDAIRLNYPEQGWTALSGVYMITDQDIELGSSIRVSEKGIRV